MKHMRLSNEKEMKSISRVYQVKFLGLEKLYRTQKAQALVRIECQEFISIRLLHTAKSSMKNFHSPCHPPTQANLYSFGLYFIFRLFVPKNFVLLFLSCV